MTVMPYRQHVIYEQLDTSRTFIQDDELMTKTFVMNMVSKLLFDISLHREVGGPIITEEHQATMCAHSADIIEGCILKDLNESSSDMSNNDLAAILYKSFIICAKEFYSF